jgi:hypothetical protein
MLAEVEIEPGRNRNWERSYLVRQISEVGYPHVRLCSAPVHAYHFCKPSLTPTRCRVNEESSVAVRPGAPAMVEHAGQRGFRDNNDAIIDTDSNQPSARFVRFPLMRFLCGSRPTCQNFRMLSMSLLDPSYFKTNPSSVRSVLDSAARSLPLD